MRYLGGKTRLAKYLRPVISSFRLPEQLYLEPFLGAAGIFHQMDGPKVGADAHLDLMLMWQALQNGWQPPTAVSESEYLDLKVSSSSALRGFCGFGCAYGGDWFHGYAKDNRGDDYVGQSRRSLLRRIANMTDAVLLHADYKQWDGIESALIYCDPPYSGTSSYSKEIRFDHQEFWDRVRMWSQANTVLVSEFNAPPDFEMVWEKPRSTCLRYSDVRRVRPSEKLFKLRD